MRAPIRSIDVFPVSLTLPRPVGDGQGLQAVRQSMFVEVTVEDGTYGWGEGGSPDPGALQLRPVAPALVGTDALDTAVVYARAARSRLPRSLLGALDLAVWDLKGKVLGLSVARLLGGALRERVPAYASFHSSRRHWK
jgi:D-galactarolactone cycloisomerase